MTDPFLRPGIEPGLDEMLSDPIVQAVMRRDQVTSAEVRAVLALARARAAQARLAGSRTSRGPIADAGLASWPMVAAPAI